MIKLYDHTDMRTAMNDCIYELGKSIKDLFFLSPDGSVSKLFEQHFPERFIDVGIAQENLINVATGLALTGKKVIVNSIASFLLQNAYMQIRNGLCYSNLNVSIIGVGCGLSFSIMGQSHQTLEDIAMMRILPNMRILIPSDPYEAQSAVAMAINTNAPCYIRLIAQLTTTPVRKEISSNFWTSPCLTKENGDFLFISMGTTLASVQKLAEDYENEGVSFSVLNLNSINFYPNEVLVNVLKKYKMIISIEEHYISGGISSYISEILFTYGISLPFHAIGAKHEFCTVAGTYDELLEYYGLDKNSLKTKIDEILKKCQ